MISDPKDIKVNEDNHAKIWQELTDKQRRKEKERDEDGYLLTEQPVMEEPQLEYFTE